MKHGYLHTNILFQLCTVTVACVLAVLSTAVLVATESGESVSHVLHNVRRNHPKAQRVPTTLIGIYDNLIGFSDTTG